jgi:integrase
MGIYKNGTNYYYTFNYRRKRYSATTGTDNHDKAFTFYLDQKAAITGNKLRYVDKTWGDLVNHYIDSYHPNDQRILRWTLRFWEKTRLEDLTGPEIKKIQWYRAMRVKGSTANRQFAIVRSLLRKAETDLGWLTKAPNWRKEPETEAIIHILSEEEEIRLLRELPPHLKRIVRFALATGLRKGTIVKLTMDMYDRKSRKLSIPSSIMKARKALVILVNEDAHQLITEEEHHTDRGLGLWRHDDKRPVFTYQYQKILEPASSAWRKALKRAKISMTFHDLRHTWATRMIEKGMSPAVVQFLGGWGSPKMLQRYTHINADNLELKKFGY